MRQLLIAFILLFSISIISCSDNGTGPDPNNENSGENNEETTTYSIVVDISPSDAGSISPSAENSYEEGEEIELQADPNDEYLFTHWSGDIDSTSDNPLSLNVDQDYNLTANFELKMYELSTSTEGEGSVSEEVLEQKPKDYDHGTVVELTANPAEGYKFVEWQGDITGSENPAQMTVDNPKEVTAVFEKAYKLTLDIIGEGEVTIDPEQDLYFIDSNVELTAEAAENWEFIEWQGDITSTENPIEITIDGLTDISAKFSEVSVTDISLNTNTETIYIDETIGLNATVSPEDAFNKKVIWESSDPTVATVNDAGKVIGVDKGIATITAETEDGGYTAEAEINVESFYKEVGEPYEAPDGLTVTLNSLDFIDHGNYYEYNINYTLKNDTDSIIDEGQFKMHFEGDNGTEGQYGFYGELTPGEEMSRSYTWEIDDTEPLFEELEYNNVFDSYDDPLMWKVDTN